jgi:hypothetical protein
VPQKGWKLEEAEPRDPAVPAVMAHGSSPDRYAGCNYPRSRICSISIRKNGQPCYLCSLQLSSLSDTVLYENAHYRDAVGRLAAQWHAGYCDSAPLTHRAARSAPLQERCSYAHNTDFIFDITASRGSKPIGTSSTRVNAHWTKPPPLSRFGASPWQEKTEASQPAARF